MVVSINIGPDTVAWGPGVGFPFESNVPGPQVMPLHITFELRETETEKLIWLFTYDDNLQAAARGFIRIFYDIDNVAQPVPTSQSINDGHQAIMQIVVRDDRQVIIDQGERTLPWSNTAAITNQLREIESTATGSFTPTDRATLNTTADQTLVQLQSNAAGAPLLSGLADWFTLSHGTQFFRGPVILLSGRGSLDPTAVGSPWAFGGVFSWFTVPAELGYDDGLVVHYHRVLLELGIVYADGGTDLYTDRRLAFQDDGHFVEWPMLRVPERIDYWVFPGVTVAWQFMRGAAGLTRVT